MEDDRRDQGEWGTTEYNITAPVRTEEEGGQENSQQSKEYKRGETIQKVRQGLRKEVDIYKMAKERDEDSKDVKTRSVIKDKNGKLDTDMTYVLRYGRSIFKELLNQRENSK